MRQNRPNVNCMVLDSWNHTQPATCALQFSTVIGTVHVHVSGAYTMYMYILVWDSFKSHIIIMAAIRERVITTIHVWRLSLGDALEICKQQTSPGKGPSKLHTMRNMKNGQLMWRSEPYSWW